MNLPRKVFIDTSFLIALLRSNDSDHTRVSTLHQQLEIENVRKITSEYVLLELGNSLSRLRVRPLAMNFFRRLYQDRTIEVVPTSSEIFTQALTLYNTRSDKEWGLTDCTSFVIMRKFKIDTALTMDHHFQQAGFRAFLLED